MASDNSGHVKLIGGNTMTRSISIPSSRTGVGFLPKFSPEWASVIDVATFKNEIKEVIFSHQINSICYKVYQDKEKEANKSISNGTYNLMTAALALVILSVICAAVFCYIEPLYTIDNASTILLFSTCGAAGVVWRH
jgi:hypothetical protein